MGCVGFWNDAERREHTRVRFENRMAIPILVAAALLAAVSLVLLFVDLSPAARTTLLVIDAVLWLFFALDFAVRLTLTPHKRSFLRTEWLDALLVIVPFLQPIRLVGAFLRIARLSAALNRTSTSVQHLMGRHKLYLAFAWATGLVLVASVVTPIVEPDSSKLKSFGDGIWWALVTTTTVGYGDLVPESVTGRLIGALLMIVGISIIGLVSANIAALLLEPPQQDEGDPTPDTDVDQQHRLAEIEAKLDELLRRLDSPPR